MPPDYEQQIQIATSRKQGYYSMTYWEEGRKACLPKGASFILLNPPMHFGISSWNS